jgi:hypothetical protein
VGWDGCVRPDTRLVAVRARGHVQHGAVLGVVDVLAIEHSVDLAAQVRLLRQLKQHLRARQREGGWLSGRW